MPRVKCKFPNFLSKGVFRIDSCGTQTPLGTWQLPSARARGADSIGRLGKPRHHAVVARERDGVLRNTECQRAKHWMAPGGKCRSGVSNLLIRQRCVNRCGNDGRVTNWKVVDSIGDIRGRSLSKTVGSACEVTEEVGG